MKELFFSSLSEHIGFTLLHSLWQGMIGVVLIILISRLVAAKFSTIRYWLFVGIMLLVFSVNIYTFFVQSAGTKQITENYAAFSLPNAFGVSQLSSENSSVTSYWSNGILQAMPYIVMLWWLGILALSIRLTISLWQVRRLSRANHLPVSIEVMEIFELVKLRLKFKKMVRLVQSKKVLIPSVIGHLKPIILLPVGLVNGLSNDQVEAILLHELSHIKRHDYLVNIMQSIIEVLYFFNPFIWIISKTIRDEREHASDDVAISLGISAPVYAHTLAGVFNYAIKRQQFVLAFASKNKLTLKRIQRIMKTQSNNNNKLIASMVFVMAITLSMYFGAQSHAPVQDISDMLPDRTVLAMAIPTLSTLKETPVLELKVTPMEKFIEAKQIVKADTTNPDELTKRAEEFDLVMDKLKETKEWQEVEKLTKGMTEDYHNYMIDINPIVEDALRLAEESMELNTAELLAIEEKMLAITEQMNEFHLNMDIERSMEFESRALEKAMQQMESQLEKMNFKEMEDMARIYANEAKQHALKAKAMAEEANIIAAEAKEHVEAVEDFLDELKPMLVKDGYIKSPQDLDQLNIKDGDVRVNGEKVKSKDARKYINLHDKYFDKEDNFFMNN